MTLTNFPNGISSFGVPVVPGGLPFTGNYFYVNPLIGADGNEGSPQQPLASLSGALARCVDGHNDVVLIIGNGQASGTCRLTSKLVWNKNATHLVGITAPTQISQRARIAPTTTGAAFADFVQVTAAGCMFSNFSLFNGFATGGAAQRCWIDEGQRNYYGNVDFGGMGDAASAADVGSRSLVIGKAGTGNGEHLFERCNIGLDTISRGVANASLEFLGGTPRNIFRECTFPMLASADAPFFWLTAAAAAIDRFAYFQRCFFMNAVGSTATQLTGAAKMAASAGGDVVLDNCTLLGATKWGVDATSLAQIFLNGAVPTGAGTGRALVSA
jgi:hypothetical protein